MIAAKMALAVREIQFEVICGPYFGGGMLAQAVAIALDMFSDRLVTIAAIEADGEKLRHGHDEWVRDRKVLIVDDIMTTGGSVKKAAGLINGAGGQVVATVVLWKRGHGQPKNCGQLISLIEEEIPSWPAKPCKLCRQHVHSTGKRTALGGAASSKRPGPPKKPRTTGRH